MTIARIGPTVIVGTLATNETDQAKVNFAIRRLQEEINNNADVVPTITATVAVTATINSAGTTNLDASYNGKTVFLDAAAGNITLTFTANAALPTDWFVHLIRIDGSTNTITVDPNGSETVDGRATALLINKYDQATILKQGSNFVTRNARWKQREVIYNSGTNTFTIANEVPLGCNSYFVEGWGQGGSGGGSDTGTPMRASGGGSGAYGNKRIATTLDTSLSCTPGTTGGASVNSTAGGQNGSAGGNTTIVGSNLGTLTAGGGGAGQGAPFPTGGGAGGVATGAWDETITGADGFTSNATLAATGVYPGGSAPRGGPGGCSNVGSNGRAPGGAGAGQQSPRIVAERRRCQRSHQDHDLARVCTPHPRMRGRGALASRMRTTGIATRIEGNKHEKGKSLMGTFLTPDEAQPRKPRDLDEIRKAAERIDGDWADSCIMVLAALIVNLVDYLKAKEAEPPAGKRSKPRG